MKTEIALLREIADEAKRIWDKGILPREAVSLKNLLTDRIDFNERVEPADEKNIKDTGGGCSICHGTPAVNVTGTYWMCGDCVRNRVAHHLEDNGL